MMMIVPWRHTQWHNNKQYSVSHNTEHQTTVAYIVHVPVNPQWNRQSMWRTDRFSAGPWKMRVQWNVECGMEENSTQRSIVGKASSSMKLSVVHVNFWKTSVWRGPESARQKVHLDKLWQEGWCWSRDNIIGDASDLVRNAFSHRKLVQLEKARSDMITAWSFQDQSSCWILNFLKGLDSLVWYTDQ